MKDCIDSGYIKPLKEVASGKLEFYGTEEAALFSREVEESLKAVLRKNFLYGPGDELLGFVTASVDGRGWSDTMWTRDAGVFLRELVQWGYMGHACLLAKNLIRLVEKNAEGFYTFPEYFKLGKRGSGTELDGTAAIIIGMVLVFRSLGDSTPGECESNGCKQEIYDFLNHPSSPLNYILNVLRENPLIPGSGEFGGGCYIKGEYYNVVQNNLVRLALIAAAYMEEDAGQGKKAQEYRAYAGMLSDNMEQYLQNGDGTWIWCIDPKTMKPNHDIINAPINKGFGGINGVLTMFSDVLGFEPLNSDWFGIETSVKTFLKLLEAPLRKEQFEKYGIWTQFDEFIMGLLTSAAYGHAYAIQAMLLTDRLKMAEKALNFLARETFRPLEQYKVDRESDYFFFERYYSPDAVGKVELEQGCGALNLVNVAEPAKVARLIAGIDDTVPGIVRIIPRLPLSWTGFRAANWPVRVNGGTAFSEISILRSDGRSRFAFKLLEDIKLSKLELRLTDPQGIVRKYEFSDVSSVELEL